MGLTLVFCYQYDTTEIKYIALMLIAATFPPKRCYNLCNFGYNFRFSLADRVVDNLQILFMAKRSKGPARGTVMQRTTITAIIITST